MCAVIVGSGLATCNPSQARGAWVGGIGGGGFRKSSGSAANDKARPSRTAMNRTRFISEGVHRHEEQFLPGFGNLHDDARFLV